MKKVFAKVSTCVLAVSLLCGMVPAMALDNTAPAEGAVNVAPGFFAKAIAALPTWNGTKALLSSVATAASVKNAVELVKNHRTIALIGAGVLTAGAIYGSYKLIKNSRLSNKCAKIADALLCKFCFIPC